MHGSQAPGEVLLNEPSQNHFGDLRNLNLLTTSVKTSPNPTWKGVDYNRRVLEGITRNKLTSPKFEVYSLGLD
jgi:hypothetical protein